MFTRFDLGGDDDGEIYHIRGEKIAKQLRGLRTKDASRAHFVYRIKDPHDPIQYEDYLFVPPKSLEHPELAFKMEQFEEELSNEKRQIFSKRLVNLGLAYEQQENKPVAISYFRAALRVNSECFQAFDRLFKNNLLVDEEKLALLDSLESTSAE